MAKLSSEKFREILKNDGYTYVVISKRSEPIDVNFPNLPEWHRDEFEEWRHAILPQATVIRFEYKGLNYKLLSNMGDSDYNDSNFGAVFDDNNDKVLDMLSSGDTETILQSLKTDDMKISDELQAEISPYFEYNTILQNNTEFEYVVFKVLVENGCLLFDIDDIDNWCDGDENEEDNED